MKIIISIILTCISSLGAYAASPNWSVNPASYQYQMTISSRVSIRCNIKHTNTIIVGAFVNGICRGVDSNHVNISGDIYTFLTIYSNQQIGENVIFKLYDPSTDIIYNAVDTVIFENNKAITNTLYPYTFMSNYKPTAIGLSKNLIYKTFIKNTKIANLSTKDKYDVDFKYSILSGLNSDYFLINNTELLLNKDLIADPISELKVQIRTDDLNGCTYDSVFTFVVRNDDPPPTGLKQTDSSIIEHDNIGKLAKKLIAIDDSPSDSFKYELVSGVGSEGNFNFIIQGDELLVNKDIEHDSAVLWPVRIKITDLALNTKEVVVNIKVIETINSTQPLKVNNLISPNGDNINDVFEIYNIDLYKEFHLAIYDDNGFLTNEYNKGFDPNMKYDNSWKGISDKGNKLTTGLYYYYFNNKSNSHIFKGSIYLIQSN